MQFSNPATIDINNLFYNCFVIHREGSVAFNTDSQSMSLYSIPASCQIIEGVMLVYSRVSSWQIRSSDYTKQVSGRILVPQIIRPWAHYTTGDPVHRLTFIPPIVWPSLLPSCDLHFSHRLTLTPLIVWPSLLSSSAPHSSHRMTLTPPIAWPSLLPSSDLRSFHRLTFAPPIFWPLLLPSSSVHRAQHIFCPSPSPWSVHKHTHRLFITPKTPNIILSTAPPKI